MKQMLFFIGLCGWGLNLSAQRTEDLSARPLRTDSTDIYVHLLDDDKPAKVDVCPECMYHWLKKGEVQTTRGGYDGKVLHGLYTEYYHSGNLKLKGNFDKGLKKGEWRTWQNTGELSTISQFKKGQLNGACKQFDATGKISAVFNYKNGLKHGKNVYFSDSSRVEEIYEKGILKESNCVLNQQKGSNKNAKLNWLKRKNDSTKKGQEETPERLNGEELNIPSDIKDERKKTEKESGAIEEGKTKKNAKKDVKKEKGVNENKMDAPKNSDRPSDEKDKRKKKEKVTPTDSNGNAHG